MQNKLLLYANMGPFKGRITKREKTQNEEEVTLGLSDNPAGCEDWGGDFQARKQQGIRFYP